MKSFLIIFLCFGGIFTSDTHYCKNLAERCRATHVTCPEIQVYHNGKIKEIV